jgi:hypothetical protein
MAALELEGGDYGTLYISNNGMPHKVTMGSGPVLTDEQKQSFAIDGPSQAVVGGGWVHVLSGVSEQESWFQLAAVTLLLPCSGHHLLHVQKGSVPTSPGQHCIIMQATQLGEPQAAVG